MIQVSKVFILISCLNIKILDNYNRDLATSSLNRNLKGQTTRGLPSARGRSMTNIQRDVDDYQNNHIHQTPRRNNGKIKRILLTRKYRDQNVYNDLGIRVTGGKRLPNGDLGAFVTMVNRNKFAETLGEIKEGDQVLEWNGVLLRGKTYEEVERIINSSKGEIEVIIKSNGSKKTKNRGSDNVYDNVTDHHGHQQHQQHQQQPRKTVHYENGYISSKEPPPVPAHRCIDGRASPGFESDYSPARNYRDNLTTRNYYKPTRDGFGYIQIALFYDHSINVLFVNVIAARNLKCREYNNSVVLPNPFVKIYLLPGRKVANKRRTKYIASSADPEWHQSVEYAIPYQELPGHYLEFTVWDYDKYSDNICLGQAVISLSETVLLNNIPRWYPLQSADQNTVVNGLINAPIPFTNRTNNMSYRYNPSALDIGYPAIC